MITSLTDVITKLGVLVSRSLDFPNSSSSSQFDNRSTEFSVEPPGFQAKSPKKNDVCLGVSGPLVYNDSVQILLTFQRFLILLKRLMLRLLF